jgi:HK97 gp10 family phage protein
MTDDVRVVFHDRGLAELMGEPVMGEMLVEAAEPGVREARFRAPKETGAGAFSIAAEAVRDFGEWAAHVGWSRTRFYMYFHERGTRRLPARPFLVPSFRGAHP